MRAVLIIAFLAVGCFAAIDLTDFNVEWDFYQPTGSTLLTWGEYQISAEIPEDQDETLENVVRLTFHVKGSDDRYIIEDRETQDLPHTLGELRNAAGSMTVYFQGEEVQALKQGYEICAELIPRYGLEFTLRGSDDLQTCHPLPFNEIEITDFTVKHDFLIHKGEGFVFTPYVVTFGPNTPTVTGEDVYRVVTFLSNSPDGKTEKQELASMVPQIETSPVIEIMADGSIEERVVQRISKSNTESYRYYCIELKPKQEITFSRELIYCEEIPSGNGTCQLWGDPHQRTFDGYGYSYQGECEYIAVETCKNDGTLEDFRIIADYFRKRPSKAITFVRELRLEYNGVVYALTHPDVVSVDGVRVTLPFEDPANGVFIHFAAPHKILQTKFGLTMRLDDDHSSDITLSNYYKDKVCGLCGNFDGERGNECQYRNGTNMNRRNVNCTLAHAREWALNETCPEPPPEPCDSQEALENAEAMCSYLIDVTGPFASCQGLVDPNFYYAACIYDECHFDGYSCESMEAYYLACQIQTNYEAEDLVNWRSRVPHCEPICHDGMFYNPKGDACPPRCGCDQRNGESCPYSYLEGCECPYGMMLDGTKCKQPSECGCCLDGETYISSGEEYVAEDCSYSAFCVGGNDTRRAEISCAENAECTIKDGRRDCYCTTGYIGNGREECKDAMKSCHIYGDPHFDSYDDWHYSFQGDCTYIATRICDNDDVPPDNRFEIQFETAKLKPSERFTWMTAIMFTHRGKTYRMSYSGAKTVDGVDIGDQLPYVDDETGVRILRDGDQYILDTDIGVSIEYDGLYDAIINLPPEYHGKVCGFCGNADNDKSRDNERVKKDGSVADDKFDFANSWGAKDNCPPVTKDPPVCVDGSPEHKMAVDLCFYLKQKYGPLAPCHDFRDPERFYETCVYDLCATLPSKVPLCNTIDQYVFACERNGGTPRSDWKTGSPDCAPVHCPEDYTLFGRSCYKYFPIPKNFPSAKSDCVSQCGHLVTIASTEENDFVSSFAQNNTSWIGAERNFEQPALEFQSSGDEVYTFLPERLPKGWNSFKFSVETEGDAHLLLSYGNELSAEGALYEIVLGGRDNPTSLIRRCLTCETPLVETPRSYVTGDKETTFFVKIVGTVVEVGLYYKKRILSVDEGNLIMDVRYVAFRTSGAPGTWKFYTNEFNWVTGEPWTGFNSFRMGEPSNFKEQEHCIETNFNRISGQWNDRSCSKRSSYVCEVDPST